MKEKIEFSSRLDCLFVYLCDVKLKWRYDQHLNKYLKKESQERGRKQKEQYCTVYNVMSRDFKLQSHEIMTPSPPYWTMQSRT